MKKHTLALAVLMAVGATTPAFANLLRNAGFEEPGTTADHAASWQWDVPDQHGSTWGTAARKQWHVRSGAWSGTILGTWSGGADGGWWQEAPATPGVAYTFSGWFRADADWSVQGDQGIKIEFYAGESHGQTLLSSESLLFGNVGETWEQKTVQAIAPEGAQWVRVVTWAGDVGDQGALHFDDLSLVAEPGTVILLSSIPVWMLGLGMAGGISRRSKAGR